MKVVFALLLGFLIASTSVSQAASIVKATITQEGKKVALMVYTGADGGRNSDPAPYWALMNTAPEGAYEVSIKPDTEDGKTATLKGDIELSVEIRNKYSMGTIKTDTLRLVRDNPTSTRWYLAAGELKRIQTVDLRHRITIDELEHKTYSPDKTLVAGFYQDGWDETISIHDSKSGKQLKRIIGHGDFVKQFKFSPDGKLLASYAPRRGWKLWDVETGNLVMQLPKVESAEESSGESTTESDN